MFSTKISDFVAIFLWTLMFINMGVIRCIHQQFCPFFKTLKPPPVYFAEPDGKCAPELQNCDPDSVFYTNDGSCNNLRYSYFGQALYSFERILPANYSDGYDQPRVSVDGSPLPMTRAIRTIIMPNGMYRSKDINVIFYAFGQYNSHDASEHRPIQFDGSCCENGKPVRPMPYECFPTIMPPNDYFYSKFGVTCVNSQRSMNTRYLNCPIKPIRQINFQTAFLDLSILYGCTEERSQEIRLFKGGLLKAEDYDDTGYQEYPFISGGPEKCPLGGIESKKKRSLCFYSGDNRINQNPEIFAMNTIFFRLHNYIATQLLQINKYWRDQQLYLIARRICVAMYQHIFGAEFVPAILGSEATFLYKLYSASYGYVLGYDPSINPQTFHEYTSSAGRSGHSTVKGYFEYRGPNGETDAYRLREKYFSLGFFLKKNVFLHIIETYAFQGCERQDSFFTEELNNFLFPQPDLWYGNDLSSLDMDRGREFGVASYNQYREICGLCKLRNFEDLAAEIMDPMDVYKLKSIYRHVDDIDLYVGGILEKPYKDSSLGPTFTCLLGAQYHQWKFGDRKYYEFPTAKFKPSQLRTIRDTTFSQILCLTNPGLERIPKNAFYVESNRNPVVMCDDIPKIDLIQWREM